MTYLRWQQAEGRRHALMISDDGRNKPQPSRSFRTLCGTEVTPWRGDFCEYGSSWLDPTCWDCHDRWVAMDVTSTGVLLSLRGAPK